MKKRRVLIIIDSLKSGGAEKVLTDILNNLKYTGYFIDLLLINKVGEYLNDIPKNVNIFYLIDTYSKEPSIFDRCKFKILHSNPRLIAKIILKNNYDLGIAFLEGDSTFILSKLNNINRKVAWIHTDIIKHGLFKNYKRIYESIDEVICVSNNSNNSLIDAVPEIEEKTRVIYNPIDKNKIVKLSNGYDPNLDGEVNIVSVGRLVEAKGFDLLIKAHKIVLQNGIKHKVYILGEGNERKNIEKLIKDLDVSNSVKLIGFKSNPYPFIKKSDIYVSASRYEGFSLVLAEAITLRKAILSTKTIGANELLNNGEYGIMTECDNIEMLSKKLQYLILNKEKRIELESNVNSRKDLFELDGIIDSIERILLGTE